MVRLLGPAVLACLPMIAARADEGAAARFGARENVQDISLSPDGKRVAFIVPRAGQGTTLFVATLDGPPPKPIMTSSGKPERLSKCNWTSTTRLVCRIFMILDGAGDNLFFTRVIAVDADGSNVKLLTPRDSWRALGIVQSGGTVIDWLGEEGATSVLMTRAYVPEDNRGTLIAEDRKGLGVDRVDTVSLKRSVVEGPRRNAAEYISDGHGEIRVMGIQIKADETYNADRIEYTYRLPGDRSWKKLSSFTYDGGKGRGFNPDAVDRDLNIAYGFDDANGRLGLYRVTLDGTLKRELVYARDDVDVSGLIRIGRDRRVVGVSYVTDKRSAVFFDPELKKLAASLTKALPGQPLLTFVDASAGEQQLLLFASSDVDPGHYYLFDKTTHKLGEVLPARPELAQTKLATVKPVTFAAADGTQIPGFLTLPVGGTGKNLPAIVMPHGGPGARDEWGFDWLAQFFAHQGYAVLQPNFRGSTGYGEGWFQDNGFKSWRTAIGDVNDGGRWLVAQGIAAPDKLAIVGWSYGGYAALQSQVLDPDLFKAIVAIAPVTDLNMLREESRNFTNFISVDNFIGQGPHVREGSPLQHVDMIKAPVLIFHGDKDLNVGVGESRAMTGRLKSAGKSVDYVEFHGLDHQLDDSAARTEMLGKADAFLRTALGIK
ncbi:MAG: S9 family peptidase [Sphingomonas sp. 28-62-20]|nr:MAG: S9 family peptidase [Sphingomonas sp. 28-62-20]